MMLFWTRLWWWWLLAVFVSWLTAELTSIAIAHAKGDRHITEYTLSDTIRRWSSARRWLAPIAVGTTAMLLFHFFAQVNPI
jgi:hypothetical protein